MKAKVKSNSFSLFFKAFGNTKHEMWISVQVLMVITILLSIILYVVEHVAQPEVYHNVWDSVLWSFMQYIGDPGHFTDYEPITVVGRIIAALIGIIGIAIFAVPAGLIGSGFMDAITEEKKERQLIEASVILHKRFRRTGQASSWFYDENKLKHTYKLVPRYRSIIDFQVKTGMGADCIIETVNYCPDFRLQNMSSVLRRAEEEDRLVVEHFPLNTEYGCFLNRESDVTIVSPTRSLGIGNCAFSLAAMGGFNYVSKELEPYPDEPFGFYTMAKSDLKLIGDYSLKEDVESQALHFIDDLKTLKNHSEEHGHKHWFIFVLGTTKSIDCQVHFWRLATDKKRIMANQIFKDERQYGSTILQEDEETLQHIFSEVQQRLEKKTITIKDAKQIIVTDIDNTDLLKGVLYENIMCRVGGGVDCNALTIRLGYEIAVFNTAHLLVLKDIADAIKSQTEPDRKIPEDAKRCFLELGDGYADGYGKTDLFETDPVQLRILLERWRKDALEKYEHLDLDGNEQEDYAGHHKQSCWTKFRKIIS